MGSREAWLGADLPPLLRCAATLDISHMPSLRLGGVGRQGGDGGAA